MKNDNIKRAFTLAEIMIVLTVIGIISAILVPTAFRSTPDEVAMKFKKANTTMNSLIREITTSGRYFQIGNLKCTPTTVPAVINDASSPGYLCQVFADILSVKTQTCTATNANGGQNYIYYKTLSGVNTGNCDTDANSCNTARAKARLDSICSGITTINRSITTADGIVWYEANNGMSELGPTDTCDPECQGVECNTAYKVFCIKIGEGDDAEYFGYGIRSDGNMLTSTNTDTYIEKSIKNSD